MGPAGETTISDWYANSTRCSMLRYDSMSGFFLRNWHVFRNYLVVFGEALL